MGSSDCDELDPTVFVGATEIPYDGVDQDCSGADLTDVDGDGVPYPEDCDDTNASVWPGVPESCNGIDDDCDERVDEEPWDGPALYRDADADGYGRDPVAACALESGLSPEGGDCDDVDAAVHPGADERCDEIDNNCDGRVDWMVAGVTHSTVQEAIEAACDEEPNVWVPSGRWRENLWLARAVSIEGAGAAETILDGSDCTRGEAACSVVEARGDFSISISQMTLTGGNAEFGGGLLAEASSIAVADCRIEHNTADYGGGAWFTGDALVVRSAVDSNTALSGYGGGVGVAGGGGGSFELSDSEVTANVSQFAGGGLSLGTYSEANLVSNNVFQANSASEAGGAIYIGNGTSVVLRDNEITGNGSGASPGGGGVACMDSVGRSRTFGGNIVSGNSPDDWWPSLAGCSE